MKTFLFSLLILISFLFFNSPEIKTKELSLTDQYCDDFWYEIKYDNGNWWRYEYCGSELVNIIPYDWD
jgi:hypothetical protein